MGTNSYGDEQSTLLRFPARFLDPREKPHGALPTFARTGECTRAMTNDARIEIRLPEQRRRELVELAAEKSVSRAGLVRMGINRLIEHPDAILKFPQEAA